MKKLFFLFLMTTLSTQANYAAPIFSSLEGYWQSERKNVTIRVVHTNYGIKAKRSDSGQWHYYDRIKNGVYRDQEGNQYLSKNNSRLIWESRDGRKRLSFRRTNSSYDPDRNGEDRYYENGRNDHRYDDRGRNGDRYNDYRNDDPYYGSRDHYGRRDDFKVRQLQGKWYNRRYRKHLHVLIKKYGLKVRIGHGHWEKFEERSNGYFVDHHGNTISLRRNGLLIYESRRGRARMAFSRR